MVVFNHKIGRRLPNATSPFLSEGDMGTTRPALCLFAGFGKMEHVKAVQAYIGPIAWAQNSNFIYKELRSNPFLLSVDMLTPQRGVFFMRHPRIQVGTSHQKNLLATR